MQYLDEDVVMYPCGHNVVIYNTETRAQTLIHGSVEPPFAESAISSTEGITAIAVTQNRRLFAIAERGAVGIYDSHSLKRKRVLSSADGQEIRSVSFSSDAKQVLTLGAGPDWPLVLWTTDRLAKVTASIKLGAQNAGPGHGAAAAVGTCV